MSFFYIKEIDAGEDIKLMKDIVEHENIVFGEGSVGKWNIKPFAKYGKVFVIVKSETGEKGGAEEELVSVIEVLSSFKVGNAFIYGVSTVPKYENQGFAGKLLGHVMEYLSERNITEIDLTVAIDNEKAQRIYRNAGFEIAEKLENEYGENIDRYLMKYKKK